MPDYRLPKHVAIVMDGNGRYAKAKGLARINGHRAGAKVAKEIVKHAATCGIPVLSLFAFSSENWLRPKGEVSFIMELFIKSLKSELIALHNNNIRLRFSGDLLALKDSVQQVINEAEALTHDNDGMVLNIMFNYGGKWDIVQAAKKIADLCRDGSIDVSAIDEVLFARHLCLDDLPDPELFIRTSGEHRISNFYLWQLAYTELYFCDTYWPDFTTAEFDKALAWFNARERRFGLTSEQVIGEKDV